MNDISVILAKIDEDARTQSAAIAAAAQDNCRKIKSDYDKEAEAVRNEILQAGKDAAEALTLRAASQSGIEQRNLRLNTRRKAMDAAFEKAMEKLCSMSDEKKVAMYSELAAKLITGQAELVLNAAEKASIGKAVTAMVGKKFITDGIDNVVDALTNLKLPDKKIARVVVLAEDVGTFRGGFMLREGNIETNCTFEVMVSAAKDELEPEVAKLLFG